MKSNFELKGWLAVGVTLAAAVALILSVTLLNRREVITVEPFGVTHFGAVHVDDGSVSEPSLGFTGDTDVGFYRVCANDIGVSAGGSKVGDFTSAGWRLDRLDWTQHHSNWNVECWRRIKYCRRSDLQRCNGFQRGDECRCEWRF